MRPLPDYLLGFKVRAASSTTPKERRNGAHASRVKERIESSERKVTAWFTRPTKTTTWRDTKREHFQRVDRGSRACNAPVTTHADRMACRASGLLNL